MILLIYPANYINCWYYSLSDNRNITDQLFVIANIKNINLEDDSRLDKETDTLIKKQGFKVWKIDFKNSKFEEIKNKKNTNEIHCF